MNHLDLFSGIGGFSLGLEATQRINTVAFCEIDSFCTKVLNKNWPIIPVYKDIKELTYEKLKADGIGPIDIITGGYPCQPFSQAGRKKGEEDPRHLWPEYFRLIKECRPTWVIGENVSGHIKLGLDSVLADLESEGYAVRTFSISAASIGSNHKRERVWVMAYSECNDNFNKKQRVNGKKEEIQREHWEDNSSTRKLSGTDSVRKTNNANVAHTRQPGRRIESSRNTKSLGRGSFEETKWSTNTNKASGSSERTTTVADTKGERTRKNDERVWERSSRASRRETTTIPNTNSDREKRNQSKNRQGSGSEQNNWWNIEPDVGRVAHGIPDRTHRLRALGNSVVPQIPYYLAQSILESIDA